MSISCHMVALTRRGRLFSDLTREVFRTRVLMLQGAEALAASVGLTSSRWQILAMVAHGPSPVSQVARMLGLSRQAVQQIADAMEAEGFIIYDDNPDHRRARLMRPTSLGTRALARLRPREIEFANQMGLRHPVEALETALSVLRQTRTVLEAATRRRE